MGSVLISAVKYGIDLVARAAVALKVSKSGDTMTGQLTLPGGGAGSQAITYSEAYSLATGMASLLTNYNISTTVGGTPASGTIRYNNATQTSATSILMSVMASDGIDLTNFIAQLAVGDTMYLQDEVASANYQRWQLTEVPSFGSGYATLAVSLLTSAGTGTTGFADALPIIIWGKNAAIPMTTDALAEGVVNLYFTDARVSAVVKAPITVSASRALADTDHDRMLLVTGAYTLTRNSGLRTDFKCRVQNTTTSQCTFANGTGSFSNSYGIGASAKTAAIAGATASIDPASGANDSHLEGDITA